MTDAASLDAASLSVVADIGGTNTRVALAHGDALQIETIRRYRNADHADLETVLRQFLSDMGMDRCGGACVALAGPVRDGVGRMTNLDWEISEDGLAAATGANRVSLLNDLQAQGHALGRIAAENLRAVLPGQPAPDGAARLVVGLGTGFNAAPVHDAPGGRIVAPSECGHVTLPARSAEELRLARHIEEEHEFAAVEDVLSGRGLAGLHAWHSGQHGLSPADVMTAIGAGEPLAKETGRIFTGLLGRVMGDLALIHLPFGGIYLIGGVARALAPWFDAFGFEAAFHDKGRFSDFLRAFPVWLVEDDYAALQGCAAHLSRIRD
ncbi:glucokinase [Halodurantibacterium flavum]|uniref:Glucokinase n=1 Tax=Halodurantibacterium flavum TaxID=1382802 RepID=A0ABW4S5S3_9RHOB